MLNLTDDKRAKTFVCSENMQLLPFVIIELQKISYLYLKQGNFWMKLLIEEQKRVLKNIFRYKVYWT